MYTRAATLNELCSATVAKNCKGQCGENGEHDGAVQQCPDEVIHRHVSDGLVELVHGFRHRCGHECLAQNESRGMPDGKAMFWVRRGLYR